MKKLSIKLGFVFLCLLFAFFYSVNGVQVASWVIAVFFSVLFHECGHALMAVIFGKSILIELNFFGGITYFRTEGLKKWQLFLITLNGPIFSFGLSIVAYFAAQNVPANSPYFYFFIIVSNINLFWTVFNLLPILPLDGGQLLRIVFESIFKNRGLFFASIFSCIFSTALALISFLMSAYLVGSFLFLFAFQNFELMKQARYLTNNDQQDNLRKKLQEAVYMFEVGDYKKAEVLVNELMAQTKEGVIFNQALSIHVLMLRQHKNYKEIYDCLRPCPKVYETQLAQIMHEASFFQNDMELVQKLSAAAFQIENSKDVAFRSAVAAAFFKDETATIGWLKTAIELGLNEDEIKAHPMLKQYVDLLKN